MPNSIVCVPLPFLPCAEQYCVCPPAVSSLPFLPAVSSDSAIYTASFGLGLRDSSGDFWYPRTGRDYGRSDDTPENDADWALFRSHTYGEQSLLAWVRRRKER